MSDAATTFTSPTPAPRTALADDVKVETVTITASDRTEIKADYWPAKGDERAPAALLIHDAGSDRKSMTELAERLIELVNVNLESKRYFMLHVL